MPTPTYYPGKLKDPKTTTHTPASWHDLQALDEALRDPETGQTVSRADLLEHAWRQYRGMPVNTELEVRLRLNPWIPIEPEAAAK